jgi:hypothetical protein
LGGSLKAENRCMQVCERSMQVMLQQNLIQTPPAPKQPQALFSLNMPNISDLFPGFAPGDFAVLQGSPSIAALTSLLCVRAQLPVQLGGLSSNVVFIDGGNAFRLYQVARLAQLHGLNPKQALDRIYVSRAFTAYQLTALVLDHLKQAVERYNAKIVIISDIASLFLDEDVEDEEARRVYSQVISYLQNFAKEKQIILIATYPTRQNSSRNNYMQTLTCDKANVILAYRQTKYDREFALEKHPRFMLGTAEFPSDNLTLTDFM